MSLTAAVAFGQGTVWFANDTTTLPSGQFITFAAADTPGNVFGTAGAKAVGAQFYVDLYYANGAGAAESALAKADRGTSQSKLRASTTTTPGVWTSAGSVTLAGVAWGGTATLQVRAFDTTGGATWATATTLGKSELFSYAVPSAATAPAGDFYMTNFKGFSVAAVPEPSTFALAGLGAAAMLIFRRRK